MANVNPYGRPYAQERAQIAPGRQKPSVNPQAPQPQLPSDVTNGAQGQAPQNKSYTPPNGNTGVTGAMDPTNPLQNPGNPVAEAQNAAQNVAPAGAGPRTQQFIDANRNGIDDRDEPQTHAPKENSQQTPGGPQPQLPPQKATVLYGTVDQGKLNDPAHQAQSPKYQLLAAAQGMDSYDMPGLLAKLMAANPQRWAGWTISGADKLVYGGNALDPAFNGATEIDVIHGSSTGTPFGWGFQTNNAVATPPGGGGGMPSPGINPNGANPNGLPTTVLPNTPLPTYAPAGFAQWQGPDQSQTEDAQMALINQILANPHSMTDQGVEQLKQRNMEASMSMQQQLAQQLAQRGASRGTTWGGQQDLQNRRLGEGMGNEILASNRDIDITRMQQNRTDEIGASTAATDFMNAQLGRATGNYQNTLSGQTAQADENYRGYGSQTDAVRFALEQAIQQGNMSQGWQGLTNQITAQDIQRMLGLAGINFQYQNAALQSNNSTNPTLPR